MSAEMSDQEGIFEQGLRILRRRKWVVLQAVIAVPLLAFLYTSTEPEEFTATATLLFRQSPAALEENQGVIDPTREAATNGELVALPVVAEEAAKLLGHGYSGAEVLSDVAVAPSLEAETAAIAATSESPARSATIANAYAKAYINFRKRADRSQVQSAISLAETSLAKMTPAQRAGPEGTALSKQLEQLKIRQALETGGAELVQPATAPSSPSSPEVSRNVLLGVVLGLLLGFGLALILERVDRRVRSTQEMEQLYGLPIIARIPRSRRLAGKRSESFGPQTPEAEAFRVLRTNLRYFEVSRDLRSVMIVSPAAGDGKSTVARGLAMTMAEMGDDVVLVEADLRKGGEFRSVNGHPAPGLSTVLTGTSLEKVLVRVDVGGQGSEESRNLAILPSGPPPPNPAELLESWRMREILVELQDRFQTVILDSPAMAAVSDALVLIPAVGGVVIVGGLGKTTRDAANDLSRQFALLNKQPIGLIVNFAEPEHAKYSQYYRPDLADSSRSPS